MRFNTDQFRSMNEAIIKVQNSHNAESIDPSKDHKDNLQDAVIPQIVNSINAPVYALFFGAVGVMIGTQLLMDLPRTVRNYWNDMKQKAKRNKEYDESAKIDISKFTDTVMQNIPSHWSKQRTAHLKTLIKTAEALSTESGTEAKRHYGRFIKDIEAYIEKWREVK